MCGPTNHGKLVSLLPIDKFGVVSPPIFSMAPSSIENSVLWRPLALLILTELNILICNHTLLIQMKKSIHHTFFQMKIIFRNIYWDLFMRLFKKILTHFMLVCFGIKSCILKESTDLTFGLVVKLETFNWLDVNWLFNLLTLSYPILQISLKILVVLVQILDLYDFNPEFQIFS